MDTQDHKFPKLSGHEGQVYVCHTCGWPFPNPHPSAKHRRAHNKLCGKIEGYKLGDDVADKTQVMDGSECEHASDDEGKNPSGKAVEKTISRKSSSGVGSRSSRSTKSEEELFADADTDFTDGSSPGGATESVIQRFYSTVNDFDDTDRTAETASADDTGAPKVLLKDHQDQVQTIPNLTSENYIGTAVPIEEAVEKFSKTQHDEQGIIANACKETVLTGEKPELKVSYNDPASEALENASGLIDTDIEDPISLPTSTGMETASSKSNIEHLHVVDGHGNFSSIEHPFDVIDATNESMSKLNAEMEDHGLKDESRDDFNVPAVPDFLSLHAPLPGLTVEDAEASDSKEISSEDNNLKSVDVVAGEPKHDVGQNSIGQFYSVGVPGQMSSSADDSKLRSEVNMDLMTESFENEKVSRSVEEQKPDVSFEEVLPEGDNSHCKKNSSEVNDLKGVDGMEGKLNNDVRQNSIVEFNSAGLPGQTSLNANGSKFSIGVGTDFMAESFDNEKVSYSAEEQKPNVAFENFSEGDTSAKSSTEHVPLEMDIGEIKEKELSGSSLLADCATRDIPAQGKVSNSVEEQKSNDSFENVLPEGENTAKNSTEQVLFEMDSGEITGKELSGSSLLADCATSDIPAQSKELGNTHESKDTGNDGENGDVQTPLEGYERSEGKGITPVSGLNIAGSHDDFEKTLEPENIFHHGESDVMRESKDALVFHSLPLVERTGTNLGGEDSIGEDGQGVLKSDYLAGSNSNLISGESVEVREDAQCSLQSSDVNNTCTHKFAEETSGGAETDRNNSISQHLAISAVDVPDSLSQADSLEGNWSVMSALSDTPPTAGTPSSIQSQALPAEQNVSLEPKSLMQSQRSDSQTSGDQNVGVNKMEGMSEIQTLEGQQKVTSSKTSWPSSSASHVENASLEGKKDKEIIAKVTDWNTEKNHSLLKTLLGEATARSRAESPVHYNQSSSSMPLKDEIPVADDRFFKAEKVVHSSNDPVTDAFKEDVGKEWNSPARYPVNINTEKKRSKNRPWMPFLCCSSVKYEV